MSQDDTSFYKPFVFVLGALVLFTIFIAFMAAMFSPASDSDSDPLIQQSVRKQIQPIGQSRVVDQDKSATTSTDTVVVEAVEPVEADEAAESGQAVNQSGAVVVETVAVEIEEEKSAPSLGLSADQVPLKVRAVVATNCAGCHAQGVHGAPRTDDAAVWRELEVKGLFALTNSVINGKGMMRPRAETNLVDEEVAQAVGFMIGQATGVEGIAQQEEIAAGEQQAAPNSAEATETVGSVTNTTAGDDFPENIATAVDTTCAACHATGVAQAPKYGDMEDWAKRLANGIDVVLATVIAGKGAMPPRGGSQLSDAELKIAIEYMSTK